MTKRARKILFLICLIIFLFLSPSIIFYFQGYRFDLKNKKLTQTGGLFIKAIPKQVEIYLDGKLIKGTDFLFGSALIENLLPGKYEVTLQKNGYFSWKKNLEIKEKEVTEARNIILFPENLAFEHLAKGVENFWFSPDEKKIILKEQEEGWSLKMYELEKKVKSHLLKEKDISKKGANLINLEFGEDSKEIFLEVGVGEEIKYFNLDLFKTTAILVEKERLNTLPEEAVVSKRVGNDIYFVDNSGYLFKNQEKISEKLLSLQQETEYSLEISQNYIFLREGDIFYLFNRELKSFEKFFEHGKGLRISQDKKKLVFFSNSEIWVLFLEERLSQPRKKVGEKVLIARFSEELGEVFWLGVDHLIFNSSNRLKIAEIDDRDRINIVDLPSDQNFIEFKKPRIFWNLFDKKLYVLSEGNLYVSGSLLP